MKEFIQKYNQFGKEGSESDQAMYHMNCAEVLLRSANDCYQLDLEEKSYKLIQGFGGGFYAGKTCGAFSGALAGLGVLYTKERPNEQQAIKQAAQFLVEEFEKAFGSLDCNSIKEAYRDPITGCNPVKLRAGQVMEQVIKRMKEQGYE